MEMDLETRSDMGVKFLRTQYEGRKVSLARATITDRGKRTQTFHEGKARLTLRPSGMGLEGHVRSMIKRSDAGEEIFYAPTPMAGQKGRKKEQALPNVVVFGDADNGLTADVKARLTELGACLVRSGGHVNNDSSRPKYHVYLLLTREVPPAELERLNRGLKAFIQGDKFDATTLLRIPGTRNHKYAGSPIVRVERYADARHTPENLAKFLDAPTSDDPASPTSTASGVELPEVPKGFRFTATKPGYAHVRRYVREWNGKWADPNQDVRRYMAAIVITKEAIKRGLTIHEAYAFALQCEPLVDKQEEENGYSIQKDVAKIWRRETGIKPSGTLTADDILSAHQTDDARNKTSTTPAESVPPVSFTPAGMPDLGPSFPFQTPNLDELLSGDYKPLEPTLVPCGPFHLLYPGKSHGISSDRGVGKTQTTIAMVYEVMKRGGRVAYFDFEDSPDTFIRDRMMNQFGIPEAMIRGQFLYFHGTAAFDDLDWDGEDRPSLTEGIKQLAEAIKDWDLVVIDGVTASMSDWSVEDDKTKPNNSLDGGKATDYTWWYDRQVKPFLKVGLATLQIDHVNKTGGNRVSGTGQKGAKFTGVEYELRAEKNGSLVMGGTGKLLLSVAKDRVGRIARYKKKRPEGDDDALDVARFVMTSDIDGHVTRAMFEPVNQGTDAQSPASTSRGPVLNETEHKALRIIRETSTPLNRSKFRQLMGISNTAAGEVIKSLQSKGLIDMVKDGRSLNIVPIANAPEVETPGQADLDFSQVDRKPKAARRQLECHRCRDLQDYPEEFLRPDDIGYQPGRRLCRSCAGENIEIEDYQEPRDGAEWARGIRESIERERDTHEDD